MTCNRIVVRVPRNKLSFTIPVTVWVAGKKVTVDALIDSGATTTFIDSKIIEKNNLVFRKLAEVHPVYNADGTTNKNGNITKAVYGQVNIQGHISTNRMYVANLGNKGMIIGMTFLKHHNPEIDWARGELHFTRCPEICALKARRNKQYFVSDEESNDLPELDDKDYSIQALETQGEPDELNPYIRWLEITEQTDHLHHIRKMVNDQFFDKEIFDDDPDTKNWKEHVPKPY